MTTHQHVFSEVPKIDIPRSVFMRPHNHKTTIDFDYLYPIYVDEYLPSETWIMKANFFGRFCSPLVQPLLDNIYLDVFFFAVPNRLIDENFPKVMGDKPFGQLTSDYTVPTLRTNNPSDIQVGSLSDYFGLPVGVEDITFCPYWHRAYNLIWNSWFMDENLCTPVKVAGKSYDGTETTESISDYTLLKRCKIHDYFTSCLPWPQKGSPVSFSIAGSAPISGTGNILQSLSGTLGSGTGQSTAYWNQTQASTTKGKLQTNVGDDPSGAKKDIKLSVDTSTLSANLSAATPVTINQLREAFALQHLLELDATGGTRLIEIVKRHFGCDSPDLRALRPEYLGGFSQPLNITSVPQTSSTDSTSPQGNLSAYVTVGSQCNWIKSFTEHGVIIGLANLRADVNYQQGIHRMFSRRTRYDFYWPALSNLGEQAVLSKELFANGEIADDDVFGYQERWSEYKYHPNLITGKLRSGVPGSLDVWHLGQYFSNRPQLNSEFVESNTPISRCLAVTDEPALLLDAYFDLKCARPMPLYCVPGLGRRF